MDPYLQPTVRQDIIKDTSSQMESIPMTSRSSRQHSPKRTRLSSPQMCNSRGSPTNSSRRSSNSYPDNTSTRHPRRMSGVSATSRPISPNSVISAWDVLHERPLSPTYSTSKKLNNRINEIPHQVYRPVSATQNLKIYSSPSPSRRVKPSRNSRPSSNNSRTSRSSTYESLPRNTSKLESALDPDFLETLVHYSKPEKKNQSGNIRPSQRNSISSSESLSELSSITLHNDQTSPSRKKNNVMNYEDDVRNNTHSIYPDKSSEHVQNLKQTSSLAPINFESNGRHSQPIVELRDFRLSFVEKNFLLKQVRMYTGVNISYNSYWFTQFKNGHLLLRFWNAICDSQLEYLDDLFEELGLTSAYCKQFQKSPSEMSNDKIIRLIEEGRTDIIFSILARTIERSTFAMYILSKNQDLITLKTPNESLDSFIQETPNSLFLRHLEFLLKGIGAENPRLLQFIDDFRDPRFYAIILNYLHNESFPESTLQEILSGTQDTETTFKLILHQLSNINPLFINFDEKDLLSDSDIIHFFLLSRIFKNKSGLNNNRFTWERLKLCMHFLKLDFPTLNNTHNFIRMEKLTEAASSIDTALMDDYRILYHNLKEKYDAIEYRHENALQTLNERLSKEKTEVISLFDAYKEHAESQIQILQENNDRLQNVLQRHTLSYEDQIKNLQLQLQEKETNQTSKQLQSLEEENKVLSTQLQHIKSVSAEKQNFLEDELKIEKSKVSQLSITIDELKKELDLLRSNSSNDKIQSLQTEIRQLNEEIFLQKHLNSQLTLTITEYREKLKESEASYSQSELSLKGESVPRDRYEILLKLTQDMREEIDQKTELFHEDLQILQYNIQELSAFCPPKTHLQLLFQKYKSNQIMRSQAKFSERMRTEDRGVWINCVGYVISRYLVYWREIDVLSEADPLTVIPLDCVEIACCDQENLSNNDTDNHQSGSNFDYQFQIFYTQAVKEKFLNSTPHNGDGSSRQEFNPTEYTNKYTAHLHNVYRFSVHSEAIRQEWIKEVRFATKIFSIHIANLDEQHDDYPYHD